VKNNRNLNQKGIGLGLCICKQISQIFGGDVTVQSQKGHGSTFTFEFVLESEDLDQKSEESKKNEMKPSPSTFLIHLDPEIPDFDLNESIQNSSDNSIYQLDSSGSESDEQVIEAIDIDTYVQ
jgi:hypothetical protein